MNFETLVHNRKSKVVNSSPEAIELKYVYGRSLAAYSKNKIDYPFDSISIIIPSRLEKNPVGKLWLEDAIDSIMEQSLRSNLGVQILIGVDEDSIIPDMDKVTFVRGGKSQAAALNAAIKLADGDLISFLEDDDFWHKRKLDESLKALNTFDFVSSNQMEFITDINGLKLSQNINDYPTPSGWIMKKELFDEIGPFNEEFRFHMDSEWLGRFNQTDYTRCHMVESGCPAKSVYDILNYRTKLGHVVYESPVGSCIWSTPESTPLVFRATHEGSGMQQIATNEEKAAISRKEHHEIFRKYRSSPW